MSLDSKGRNEGSVSTAGFEGEEQVRCSFYWIRKGIKRVGLFRFERGKCLDSGYVFDECLSV